MIGLYIALGALPFALGGLLNWYMLTHQGAFLLWSLGSVLFLLIWGGLGFLLNWKHDQAKKVTLFLNLIPLIVLLLVAVQELILGAYWGSFIGIWSQHFYLPLMGLGFIFTGWSSSVFPAYVISFLLMVGTSFVGASLRERWNK